MSGSILELRNGLHSVAYGVEEAELGAFVFIKETASRALKDAAVRCSGLSSVATI